MALNLKYGKDDENRNLRTAFDSDAANYDAIRPRYCPELFHRVVEAAELHEGKCCLEIGPGTGQATEPILAAGCAVTAVELGKHLADFLAQKYAQNPDLTVWQGDFLEYPEDKQFDMIFSATAFHWIPREEGLAKVMRLLKPGGTLVLFWNHPLPGGGVGTPGEQALQSVYKKYGKGRRDNPFDGSTCPAYCDALRQAGFAEVRFELFEAWRELDGQQYVMLLRSYSDHAKMTPEEQASLEQDMKKAILDLGGKLPIKDLMDLYIAKKPE